MNEQITAISEAKRAELKNLYYRLYERNKEFVDSWREGFVETVNAIADWKLTLAESEIVPERDREALNLLITMENNSISSCLPTARTRQAALQELLKDGEFLKRLRAYLLNADAEEARQHFDAMVERWREVAEGTPVIWNRVVAAVNENVSTTVSEAHFNRAYNWLVKKLFQESGQAHDWLARNEQLMRHIYAVFEDDLREGTTDKFRLRQFVWLLSQNLNTTFSLRKQIVKFGPPGTGKTYLARKECEEAFDCWQRQFAPAWKLPFARHYRVVQFHPSFTYEDFIEGMRPKRGENGQSELVLQNGVFKTFCRESAQWEIDLHGLKTLPDEALAEVTVRELETACREQLADKPYWDYLWALDEDFKGECTVEDALPPFFFVIDEINRAELSRVFGELMICLEYRGSRSIGLVQTQYAGIDSPETAILTDPGNGTHHFFIPHNLYLLGTMNTIDRSVESFDFALRRRFTWQKVEPEPRLVEEQLQERGLTRWAGLGTALDRLNEAIRNNREHLGEEYRIGHAYLMNLRYPTELNLAEVKKRIWADSLEPLLAEYLRGCGDEGDHMRPLETAFRG